MVDNRNKPVSVLEMPKWGHVVSSLFCGFLVALFGQARLQTSCCSCGGRRLFSKHILNRHHAVTYPAFNVAHVCAVRGKMMDASWIARLYLELTRDGERISVKLLARKLRPATECVPNGEARALLQMYLVI